jgi:hypothetical protein
MIHIRFVDPTPEASSRQAQALAQPLAQALAQALAPGYRWRKMN